MPSSFDPYSPYYARVRHALTGNQLKGPKNEELTFLVEEVVADLSAGEPGILIDFQGNVSLAGRDLTGWLTWVACETAARWIKSPAAQTTEMMLSQVKYGDQSKTFRSLGPELVAEDLRLRAKQARLTISAIRNRIAARNQAAAAPDRMSGGFGAPGRRRVLGQPRTVQGQALQTSSEEP